MNKTEFLRAVAEKSCMSIKDATNVFNSVLAVITEELQKGEKITITGFGTFKSIVRKSKDCRNPHTGEQIRVPERTVPHFKPGNSFKDALK